MKHENPEHGRPPDLFVEVRVITTAAVYPTDGSRLQVADKQKLSIILDKAARELGITDPSTFVVKVNGSSVDASGTYEGLGLTGQVDLRWGPEAGAGGGE